MKVILLKEIEKLGMAGDVKTVSDGYARNFLIPRDLAEPATASNLKTLASRVAGRAAKGETERKKLQDLAEKLQTIRLRFSLKMGEKNQAFGSVTAQDIIDELAKHGVRIEKQWLELEHGIKTAGERGVKLKFPHKITGEIKILVEAE